MSTPTSYTFTYPGGPSGSRTYGVYGINNSGQIVLYDNNQSYLYRDGIYTTILDPLTGDGLGSDYAGTTGIWGINNNGEIVGTYYDDADNTLGFLFTPAKGAGPGIGTYTTIDYPSAYRTEVFGINDAGDIVGTYQDVSGDYHGFLFSGGNYITIDDPLGVGEGDPRTEVFGINNAGQIVGNYDDAKGGIDSFLFTPTKGAAPGVGAYITIDDPSVDPSLPFATAYGINNEGQIVGDYFVANSIDEHGFIYDISSGTYTAVDDPSATDTVLYGINDSGEIVGQSNGDLGFTASPSGSLAINGADESETADVGLSDDPIRSANTFQQAGVIRFTDTDTAELPTGSILSQTVTATDQSGNSIQLTGDEISALEAAFTVEAAPNNTNNGSIDWTYLAQGSELDFIADGETVVVTSTVKVADQDGNSQAATVAVTLDGPPTLLQLAQLDQDVYDAFPLGPAGWDPFGEPKTDGEFQAQAYINPDHSQVVIAIRGTESVSTDPFVAFKNWTTNIASFSTGTPSAGFETLVSDASSYLAQVQGMVEEQYPEADITLTGHSLGGAVAQLVGEASGYTTETFNAPGAAALYSHLSSELQPAAALSSDNPTAGIDANYRVVGDLVGLLGSKLGTQYTITDDTPLYSDSIWNIAENHSIETVVADLNPSNGPKTVLNGGEPNPIIAALPIVLVGTAALTSVGIGAVLFSFIANKVANYFDPAAGASFEYSESADSPLVTSVTFFADPAIASYKIWWQVGNSWSLPTTVSAGTTLSFGAGTDSFKYEGLSATGQDVPLPDGYFFDLTYASATQVNANIEVLGISQGKAVRDDFNGDGVSDIFFRNDASGDTGFYQLNSSGAIQSWHALGPTSTAWSIVGTGDFNGDGVTDILFRDNSTGDTGVNLMNSNGAIQSWHALGLTSTAWSVVGTGDFNGDGVTDVLFRDNSTGGTGFNLMNSSGGILGWRDLGLTSTDYFVVGTGDFTGSGTSDILFRDNAGAGDTGFYQMVNGVNTGWHDIGATSTAYSVVGIGDFTGSGTSDILFRDNTGAGDTGFYEMVNGVNTGWHDIGATSTAYSVVGIGDFTGSGTSDILFRDNAGVGDTGFYQMVNGVNTGWHDIGASSAAYHVAS